MIVLAALYIVTYMYTYVYIYILFFTRIVQYSRDTNKYLEGITMNKTLCDFFGEKIHQLYIEIFELRFSYPTPLFFINLELFFPILAIISYIYLFLHPDPYRELTCKR